MNFLNNIYSNGIINKSKTNFLHAVAAGAGEAGAAEDEVA